MTDAEKTAARPTINRQPNGVCTGIFHGQRFSFNCKLFVQWGDGTRDVFSNETQQWSRDNLGPTLAVADEPIAVSSYTPAPK